MPRCPSWTGAAGRGTSPPPPPHLPRTPPGSHAGSGGARGCSPRRRDPAPLPQSLTATPAQRCAGGAGLEAAAAPAGARWPRGGGGGGV